MGSSEANPVERPTLPRVRGLTDPRDAVPRERQSHSRFSWSWPLTAVETVLLIITIVIFVFGSFIGLGDLDMPFSEPWRVDEHLLALPLMILLLALVLRRGALAQQQVDARYRTLVEQLPGLIYVMTADEPPRHIYYSPYSLKLTGFTPEEAMVAADNWLEWVHPADRERVRELDANSLAKGKPFRAEYRHLRKDGSYVWVQDECVPVRDNAGNIIAYQGVVLDISARKEAESAQARLAAIVDSAEDAIISSDLEGIITSWNRGAQHLYGYRAEEVLGKQVTILFPEEEIDGQLADRIAATRGGNPKESYTAVRRRKDGTLVDVTVSLFPVRSHSGEVIGLSTITRDITAWKRAQEQLQLALDAAQEANETKSQFLAMMSHELRTPLQAILGYTEFLLANPTSHLSGEEREDLGYIQQGGQRMLSLINQLLDLSRLEAGRLEVVRKPVDLAGVLELVRQDVAPQAIMKNLDLQIIVPETLPPVMGDAERLRQILLNLVGNAVKFTSEGSVTVRATSQSDTVAVAVTDTGIGIPPEDLPQIFEAFRQVDTRLSRRHGGAGLGLAIAQRLAELMDGHISVESSPGVGSTFTLTIPSAPPPVLEGAVDEQAPPG